MNLLGSASGLHRTMKCAASTQLPATLPRSEYSIKRAQRGSAIHEYLERAPECPEAAIALSGSHRTTCQRINLVDCAGSYTPYELRERSFVWRNGVVEVLSKSNVSRDYGQLGPRDIPGTADVVVPGFRCFEIYDYKTGTLPIAVDDNPQLLFLALCAWRALYPHADSAIVGLQYVRGFGVIETHHTTVTVTQLAEFERTLHRALDAAQLVRAELDAEIEPTTNPGVWCEYCPARPGCAAGMSEYERMIQWDPYKQIKHRRMKNGER